MPKPSGARGEDVGPEVARRRPEQLLLAFLGELVVDRDLGPLPAVELIDVLEGLDVGAAATRAALARMVARGLLEPVRSGRTVGYLLTPTSERVLREARGRIFAEDPFAPDGEGWTLVTFSVPESRRDVRHRVRAQLTWAGFGLLRDGLWIAPGEVPVAEVLGDIADDAGVVDLAAFRAVEVEGLSAARGVLSAWHLDDIRAGHEDFQRRWGGHEGREGRALCELTGLVADWLALLRAVPRLPSLRLPDDWPSGESVRIFRHLQAALVEPARAELARRLEGGGAPGARQPRGAVGKSL